MNNLFFIILLKKCYYYLKAFLLFYSYIKSKFPYYLLVLIDKEISYALSKLYLYWVIAIALYDYKKK